MSQYKGWIGVDLDGTLAVYHGWEGIEKIGTPVPLMLMRVINWLNEGITVKIFTARICQAQDGYEIEDIIKIIQDYTELHTGQRLEVTNKKDFAMIQLWDDRCVQVIENIGVRVDGKI